MIFCFFSHDTILRYWYIQNPVLQKDCLFAIQRYFSHAGGGGCIRSIKVLFFHFNSAHRFVFFFINGYNKVYCPDCFAVAIGWKIFLKSPGVEAVEFIPESMMIFLLKVFGLE